MAAALFPCLSVAVLVLTVAGIVWRARNAEWVRDAQLSLNAQPRTSAVLGAFLVLCAVGLVVFGIAFLRAGFTEGWGLFPAAGEALLIVGFWVWLAVRPFGDD